MPVVSWPHIPWASDVGAPPVPSHLILQLGVEERLGCSFDVRADQGSWCVVDVTVLLERVAMSDRSAMSMISPVDQMNLGLTA